MKADVTKCKSSFEDWTERRLISRRSQPVTGLVWTRKTSRRQGKGRERWEGKEKREVDEITLDWSRLDQREEKR
jgi:hypothetical protein